MSVTELDIKVSDGVFAEMNSILEDVATSSCPEDLNTVEDIMIERGFSGELLNEILSLFEYRVVMNPFRLHMIHSREIIFNKYREMYLEKFKKLFPEIYNHEEYDEDSEFNLNHFLSTEKFPIDKKLMEEANKFILFYQVNVSTMMLVNFDEEDFHIKSIIHKNEFKACVEYLHSISDITEKCKNELIEGNINQEFNSLFSRYQEEMGENMIVYFFILKYMLEDEEIE